MHLKDILWFAAATGAAGFLLAVAPIVSKQTNCGGNSAALSQVSSLSSFAIARAWSPEYGNADGTFCFMKMSEDDTREFAHYSHSHWNAGAKFLVRTDVMTFDSPAKQIIVVCDKTYRNVPQRTFGQSPPTHAAAWSDGTIGLISPEEFARLDLSHFVDAANLATKP